MGNFKKLLVYKKAFDLAMYIYYLTKEFPKEERYSLSSQIIRSSRSVCSNLAEGYRKRRYPPHFISKISDADMENSETLVWVGFSLACRYITPEVAAEYDCRIIEIGQMLNHMIKFPEKYQE